MKTAHENVSDRDDLVDSDDIFEDIKYEGDRLIFGHKNIVRKISAAMGVAEEISS